MIAVSDGILGELVRKHLPGYHILNEKGIKRGQGSKVACVASTYKPDEKCALKVVYGGHRISESILRKLGEHPSIMKVYKTKQDGGIALTLAEYVEGKTLRDLMGEDDHIAEPIPEQAKKIIVEKIIDVIKYLQNRGLCYRDLRPDNIMIENPGEMYSNHQALRIKLVDLDDIVDDKYRNEQIVETGEYANPEQGRMKRTLAMTVYALGTLFYQMFTGYTPEEVRRKNMKGFIDPNFTGGIKEFFDRIFALSDKRYQTIDDISEGLERSGLFTASFLELVNSKEKEKWEYRWRESVRDGRERISNGVGYVMGYIANGIGKIYRNIGQHPTPQPELEQVTTK